MPPGQHQSQRDSIQSAAKVFAPGLRPALRRLREYRGGICQTQRTHLERNPGAGCPLLGGPDQGHAGSHLAHKITGCLLGERPIEHEQRLAVLLE